MKRSTYGIIIGVITVLVTALIIIGVSSCSNNNATKPTFILDNVIFTAPEQLPANIRTEAAEHLEDTDEAGAWVLPADGGSYVLISRGMASQGSTIQFNGILNVSGGVAVHYAYSAPMTFSQTFHRYITLVKLTQKPERVTLVLDPAIYFDPEPKLHVHTEAYPNDIRERVLTLLDGKKPTASVITGEDGSEYVLIYAGRSYGDDTDIKLISVLNAGKVVELRYTIIKGTNEGERTWPHMLIKVDTEKKIRLIKK